MIVVPPEKPREYFLARDSISSCSYLSVKLETGSRRRRRSACVHSMT